MRSTNTTSSMIVVIVGGKPILRNTQLLTIKRVFNPCIHGIFSSLKWCYCIEYKTISSGYVPSATIGTFKKSVPEIKWLSEQEPQSHGGNVW